MAISRTDCPAALVTVWDWRGDGLPIVGTLVFLDIAFKISSEEHKASSDRRGMATSSTLD
jgi:hypothetical protein